MYSYSLITHNNSVTADTSFGNISAKIVMHKEALGGEDAMNFANTIKELPENIFSLELDMTHLEIINSSGLGMLVKANNELKKKNIDLVLTSVPSNVLHLLEITFLHKVFKIK